MNAIAIAIDTGVSEMIKSPCCGTKVEYKFYECSINSYGRAEALKMTMGGKDPGKEWLKTLLFKMP